jgi:molybdenum cofactor synthesis domain-containing protein
MAGIDESLPFYPLGMAVLTISDTRSEETDTSGALLFERLTGAGHRLIDCAIVRDEIDAIQAVLKGWIANPEIEIILTTGGTGFSPRDNTPEAVKPLLRREMDGFAIAFQQKSGRQLHLLCPGIDRCLPRCLGRPARTGIRQPPQALLDRWSVATAARGLFIMKAIIIFQVRTTAWWRQRMSHSA